MRGQLSVGCMVTLAPMIIPELCHEFTRAFPKVVIRQQERHQEDLFDGLRRAEIDVALTYDLQIPKDIDFEPLAVLPLHVVVGEGHPLASRRSVSLEEIADEPLILLDLPISREYFLSAYLSRARRAQYRRALELPRRDPHHGRQWLRLHARQCPPALRNRAGRPPPGAPEARRRSPPDAHRPGALSAARRTRLIAAFEAHCRSFINDGYIPGMVPPQLD